MRQLITKEMREPLASTLYLITDIYGKKPRPLMPLDDMWLTPGDEPEEWDEIAEYYDGMDAFIEPLADYDATVRAEALEAEPTEDEIESAAEAIYDELCGNIIHGWLDENGDPQLNIDPFRTVFINAAVKALAAALQAVKSE